MIRPDSLISLDSVKEKNEIFHIGNIPDYEEEEYDLSNQKDFSKYLSDIKKSVRNSIEYRELMRTLKNSASMNRSGLNPNISSTVDENGKSSVKIEIHHTPLTLEDIVRVVYDKRYMKNEDLSVEMVAKEVMLCHYMGIIGLYPLTATEHELVHNGYLFIPVNRIYGNYKEFLNRYDSYIDEDMKLTLEEIEEMSNSFDASNQNKIMSQVNIYLEPSSYSIPTLDTIKDIMSMRIDTIKNNMYSLPILEREQKERPPMIEGIMFVNGEG